MDDKERSATAERQMEVDSSRIRMRIFQDYFAFRGVTSVL